MRPVVLIVATSRKTRGGITSVIKAYETSEQWKKYHCHWIQTHRDGPKWRKIVYLVTAWLDYICRLPFANIVHVHGTAGHSGRRKLPFIKLAKILKKKVIFHFHPSSEKLLLDDNELLLKIFSQVDLIIVLSYQWERWINEFYPNNKFKIKVLWNPCPIVNRNNTNKHNQILFAGSIIKRKGYNILLQAFSLIANKYNDWQLIFAGNGEINEGKSIAKQLNINDRVKWLGWVTGKEKERVFQEARIYCLASEGEGFPMGLLDAWAYGLPSITTPVGGIIDIIVDGKNGFLFPVGNTTILSNKLEMLISNNILRDKFVCETDKLVNNIFNLKTITNELGEIYLSLLNK